MRPIPGGTAKGKESRNGKEKSRDLHGAETNGRYRRQKMMSCTAPHRTAPHCTAPHLTAPHCTAPHHTAPHNSSTQGNA